MFSFDTSDIQRFTVSTIGALVLSAACVISAVGPVRAAENPASISASISQAETVQQNSCARTMA